MSSKPVWVSSMIGCVILFDKNEDPEQDKIRDEMLSHVPLGRFGSVDDIANGGCDIFRECER